MSKKQVLLAIGLVLAVGTVARADLIGVTTTERVNESVFGGSPNLTTQMRAAGTNLGGYEFANDITHSTPMVGDIVNIVTVDQFSSYLTGGTGGSRGTKNDASPATVTVITATQFKITSLPAGAINGTLINSVAGVYNTAAINVLHPASYGATDATGATFVSPTATYSLTAPPVLGIVPGANGEGDAFTAAQINFQAVNTGANALSQATALYKEINNGGFLVIDPSAFPGLNPSGQGQLGLITEAAQVWHSPNPERRGHGGPEHDLHQPEPRGRLLLCHLREWYGYGLRPFADRGHGRCRVLVRHQRRSD